MTIRPCSKYLTICKYHLTHGKPLRWLQTNLQVYLILSKQSLVCRTFNIMYKGQCREIFYRIIEYMVVNSKKYVHRIVTHEQNKGTNIMKNFQLSLHHVHCTQNTMMPVSFEMAVKPANLHEPLILSKQSLGGATNHTCTATRNSVEVALVWLE